MAESKEYLEVYHQTLLAGLKGVAQCPTNLTKVREVRQGLDLLPAAFLEQLMETSLQYTPYDLSSKEHKSTVTIAFIDQASRDIRKKLQRLEGLQDKSLKNLLLVAENVYHNMETEKEKERERKMTEER